MASISVLSFPPPLKSRQTTPKTNLFPFTSTPNSNSLSIIPHGDSLSAFACSASSPTFGKVGLQTREGNYLLLSFDANYSNLPRRGVKADSSQVLPAMIPSVVALTAVTALARPSTFTRPLTISMGFVAQYVLKPALGVLVARAFRISPMFCAGFVLMSCVAGAQLSSYASFLSRGDVALSILLTSSTTIASVIVTPLLTGLLIGSIVQLDAIEMSKSISQGQLLSAEGLQLAGPVLTFHVVAFILGYWISKVPLLRQNEEACRTISLFTGMQSSTLAGVLAAQFPGSSSQAVPAAFSVVAMAIMGLCLASFRGNGSPRASSAVYRLQSSLSEEVALIG